MEARKPQERTVKRMSIVCAYVAASLYAIAAILALCNSDFGQFGTSIGIAGAWGVLGSLMRRVE